MGFRFQRRISIVPGLRLNLSKSGVSMSLGGRGLTTNLSTSGLRTTVGIPGTGLSYRSSPLGFRGKKKKQSRPEHPPAKTPIGAPPQTKVKPKPKDPVIQKTVSTDKPKTSDWAAKANNVAAAINVFSAVALLLGNLVAFLSRLFVSQRSVDSPQSAQVIDIETQTQVVSPEWDLPPEIQPDPNRYVQTDEECSRLAREKPNNWEWLLVLRMMKLRFTALKSDWEDVTWGKAQTRQITGLRHGQEWCRHMLGEIQEIGSRLKAAYGDEELIQKAFGPDGQPGDAEKIVLWMNGVCGELAACVDWEKEVQTLRFYLNGKDLLPQMNGWTSKILEPFYVLCQEMYMKLQSNPETRQLDMSIRLEAPNLDLFNEVVPRLSTEPWRPVDLSSSAQEYRQQ